MTDHQTKNLYLMEKVLEVYSYCNLHDFPVDCFSILHHYGFRIFSYTQLSGWNPSLHQMCMDYSCDCLTFEDIIAYNEQMPLTRIRFSLMHELGHMLLEHKGKNEALEEDEADTFASYMLAPRVMIHMKSCKTAQEIHDIFGLSYMASNRALYDYKQWFDAICHTTRRPSPPEQKLEALFQDTSVSCQEQPETSPRRKKRPTKKHRELMAQSEFLKEYATDNDYFFRRAQHLRLYGEDL